MDSCAWSVPNAQLCWFQSSRLTTRPTRSMSIMQMRPWPMPEVVLFPGIFIPLPGAPRRALPLDQVRVSAGFPSPAADYEDKRLDINEYLVRNPVSTFFFSVQGDSMEGAEIFDGDILVVAHFAERDR
jgi:SOS-response transcriptional repressor LexA